MGASSEIIHGWVKLGLGLGLQTAAPHQRMALADRSHQPGKDRRSVRLIR